MGRKNRNARQRIRPKRIDVQPDIRVEVDIPKRPRRRRDDPRPGVVVAEGRVMVG
mgnify:CR=1 FL=1|jgi:hypothetical protein